MTAWLDQMKKRAWLLMWAKSRRTLQGIRDWSYPRLIVSVVKSQSSMESNLLAGQQLAVVSAEMRHTRQDRGQHRSACADSPDVRQPSEICTRASVPTQEVRPR